MASDLVNCPANKDINLHFRDQLTLLSLQPKSQDDQIELMQILNYYLSFPDDQLANNHRNANKLGFLDLTADERVKMAQSKQLEGQFMQNIRQTSILKVKSETCQCCGFIIQQHEINVMSSDLRNVVNLGTATTIFFKTFVNIGILLLIMTIVYSAFAFGTNISTAYSSNYLNSSNSTLDYLSISLGSKSKFMRETNNEGSRFYQISSWLGVAMLVIWWFIFGYFKNEISKIQSDHSRNLGVSDFSIVVENMPTDFSLADLQKQFNQYLQMLKQQNEGISLNQIKVVKYNEGKPFYLNQSEFTDEQLKKILQEQSQAKQRIASYVKEYMQHSQFVTSLAQRRSTYVQLQDLTHKKNNKYREIVNKIKLKMNSANELAKTVVFVTFLTHQMRQFILSYSKNTLFHKLKRFIQCWKKPTYFSAVKDNRIHDDIKIQQPPQPEDINWGNIGLTFTQKLCRKCFTIFTTIVMIGICFVIVYGLSTVQNANKKARFVSFLISLAVSITNLFIIKVIQYMTLIEKDYSMNNFQISIAIKSVIAQLINSIFVPVMVNYYVKDDIFGTSGLVQDIFILGITSSIFPPIVRLVDPYNIFLIMRFKYYSQESRRLLLSQYQFNQICQKMEFQIGYEYIYMISNFLFICFFVSLQPILSLFAVIGVLLMYWVEKYTLLNRSQRPVPGPDVITATMYQLIFFGPICFALGNLTWSWFLPDESFRGSIPQNLISAGLSLVIFLFPYDICTSKKQIRQTKDYNEKRIYFPSQYDRLNPSTSRYALQQYRIFLNQKRRLLQQSGDLSLSQSLFHQLANAAQKNIYKGNIMNKLTQNKEDLVIQQIFHNQSRNVINPMQLLSLIQPAEIDNLHKFRFSSKNPTTQKKINSHSKVNVGPSMKEMLPEPSSKNLMDTQRIGLPPKQVDDYFNFYKSNIDITQIFQAISKKAGSKNQKPNHSTL